MSTSSGDNNISPKKKKKNEEDASSGTHRNPILVTPTRVPIPRVAGAGDCAGAGGMRTPSRGRPRRKSDPGASGSGSSSRAKAVLDAPEQPPPCEVCGRVFSSWKALFGHMRSHPERPWRGVKPPPVFTPPGSPGRMDAPENVLIRALTQIGENILGRSPPQGSSPPARAYFNLNDDPMEEDVPSPKKQRKFGLDLNKPAPEDDDNGNGK